MTLRTELQTELDNLFRAYGNPIRIKIYSAAVVSGTSVYDDNIAYTQNGSDIWTYGLKQCLSNKYQSSEAQLVEQGRLLFSDSKIYINGSISTSGATMKIGVGSPIREEYQILPMNTDSGPDVNDGTVYKKLYCRHLVTGSLDKE